LVGSRRLPVVVGQVVVAGLVGHRLVAPVRERVGAGGGDPQALVPGRLDQGPAGVADGLADRVEGGAHRGVHLHHRAVQLGLDVVAQLGLGLGQDPAGHRTQLAGDRVDELVLLLDAEGEPVGQSARPSRRSTNWR
jgi:hypothetical protein